MFCSRRVMSMAVLVWGAVVCLASAALAAGGPYKVATGYYQFLNLSEPLVATDRNIDLWAEV